MLFRLRAQLMHLYRLPEPDPGHPQVRVSEYNQLKGQLAALNRKRTGNLAVRDLSNIVDAEVSTETDPQCSRAQGWRMQCWQNRQLPDKAAAQGAHALWGSAQHRLGQPPQTSRRCTIAVV